MIKKFAKIMVGAPLAGEALRLTAAHVPGGIGRATQSFIALGLAAEAYPKKKIKFL